MLIAVWLVFFSPCYYISFCSDYLLVSRCTQGVTFCFALWTDSFLLFLSSFSSPIGDSSQVGKWPCLCSFRLLCMFWYHPAAIMTVTADSLCREWTMELSDPCWTCYCSLSHPFFISTVFICTAAIWYCLLHCLSFVFIVYWRVISNG